MHGVQPTAKTTPEAERGQEPAPAADEAAAQPLAEPGPALRPRRREGDRAGRLRASAPAAPASSGRHVRSRAGIVRIPARFRPITIRRIPPIVRRAGR